jgi:hypothetical protein
MLDHETLKEGTVHEGDAELLGHSLCHGLATALGLTGDRDDPHGYSPLRDGTYLQRQICFDASRFARCVNWKIIPSGQG